VGAASWASSLRRSFALCVHLHHLHRLVDQTYQISSEEGKLMKRDMELMRTIHFKIEDEYEPGQGTIDGLEINGYDMQTIAEHCDLLLQQGLIKSYTSSYDITTGKVFDFMIGNLTAQGYDYLELIKNNEVWEKTKTEIVEKRLPNPFEEIGRVAGVFVGNVIKELNG
jgi:hypothetical protein